MYPIKPSITFAHGYSYGYFTESVSGDYRHNAFFLGFTGPVPADLESLPFDQSDLFEMYAQAEIGIAFGMEKIDSSDTIAYVSNHTKTYLTPKQPYLDQRLNKWSFVPVSMLQEDAWKDWKSSNLNSIRAEKGTSNSVGYQRISGYQHSSMIHTEFRYNYIMQGMRFLWNTKRYRDRNLTDVQYDNDASNGKSYNFYSEYSESRYAYNYPLILEFNEDIEVDSLEYFRGVFSDNRYSSDYADIEVWSDTANDGAGGWTQTQRVTLNEDGASSKAQYIELETIVTGKIFRILFSDANSYSMHFAFIRLLSSTPPTTLPVNTDITWGLILPYHHNAFRFDSFLYRESYVTDVEREGWFTDENFIENPEVHKLPIPLLLVDVDDPNRDAAVTLTKARNIESGEVPELLDFTLDLTKA